MAFNKEEQHGTLVNDKNTKNQPNIKENKTIPESVSLFRLGNNVRITTTDSDEKSYVEYMMNGRARMDKLALKSNHDFTKETLTSARNFADIGSNYMQDAQLIHSKR